ncbi:uncharacterized protein [Amphiura filiformis]|uniref:uncharacterized protein n=1 Tax=Amphiura filiformis TaxID=82378 RepID=UPI003B21D132
MELDISFILTIIVAAHLGAVQSHVCVLEKRPDPSRGGALRWSLPFAEICLCQRVLAPVFLNAKTCPRRKYKDGDLWFVDDPDPFSMRYNWIKDILGVSDPTVVVSDTSGESSTIDTTKSTKAANFTNGRGSSTVDITTGRTPSSIANTEERTTTDGVTTIKGVSDPTVVASDTSGESSTIDTNKGTKAENSTNGRGSPTVDITSGLTPSSIASTEERTSIDGVTTIKVCMDYLGMTNGDIPDDNIHASSEYSDYGATEGRLNGPKYWKAQSSQIIWIQADIGYQTNVSGVITQGSGQNAHPDYVTAFAVSTFVTTGANQVFVEDQNGIAIEFPGNVDYSTELTTIFSKPVYARIVRINCLASSGYYRLRFEILGCK